LTRITPYKVSLTPAHATRATRTSSRRRRSAKARNRGRERSRRVSGHYGDLRAATAAKRKERRLCERDLVGNGPCAAGGTLNLDKKTVAHRGGAGDRACGAIAGR